MTSSFNINEWVWNKLNNNFFSWKKKLLSYFYKRINKRLIEKKMSSSLNITSAIFSQHLQSGLDFFPCFDKHLRPHWRFCLDYLCFQIINVFYFTLENFCLNIAPEILNLRGWCQGIGPARASGRHAQSNGLEIYHPQPS